MGGWRGLPVIGEVLSKMPVTKSLAKWKIGSPKLKPLRSYVKISILRKNVRTPESYVR